MWEWLALPALLLVVIHALFSANPKSRGADDD